MAKTTTKKTTKKKVVKTKNKIAPVTNVADVAPVTAEDTLNKIDQLIAEDESAPTGNEVTEITLAKFKKLFKDEIKETTEWLWREDKEGDFPNRAVCKEAALKFVIENHQEYDVV